MWIVYPTRLGAHLAVYPIRIGPDYGPQIGDSMSLALNPGQASCGLQSTSRSGLRLARVWVWLWFLHHNYEDMEIVF